MTVRFRLTATAHHRCEYFMFYSSDLVKYHHCDITVWSYHVNMWRHHCEHRDFLVSLTKGLLTLTKANAIPRVASKGIVKTSNLLFTQNSDKYQRIFTLAFAFARCKWTVTVCKCCRCTQWRIQDLLFWRVFCRKPHENEKKMDWNGRASLLPPLPRFAWPYWPEKRGAILCIFCEWMLQFVHWIFLLCK